MGVGRTLRAANKAYNRRLQDQLAECDIGLAEFLHLRELWITDGLSQIELARRIGIEKASSTYVISSLEKKGIICRRRNARDRRVINVYVTARGTAMREDILGLARVVALEATRGFTESELETLVLLLERFGDGLSGPD